MAFDLDSAKPAEGGFDLASATPVGEKKPEPEKPKAKSAMDLLPTGHAALGEGAMAMGSGMLAKPISDIAGLAATGKEMLSPTPGGGDPQGFQRQVQESMTYRPRTPGGDAVARYNPLALLGMLFGKAGEMGGGAVNRIPVPAGVQPYREAAAHGVEEAIPQLLGMGGMKGAPKAAAATGDALKGTARDLMQSALKPPLKAQQTGKSAKAIDTLLDEGINVTRGGVETLQTRIEGLNDRIAKVIANSPAVVNKQAVGYRLQGLIDRFEKQVNPLADVKAIQKAWDEFLTHPMLNGPDIPVKTAQEMKQGTYRALGDKAYGELKGAEIEAQKTLARGLKEEIARAVPEVRTLNAQESQLLNALSLTERRVLMEANKNPVGLGWLSASPTKFAAWMADRSGLFKSIVARMVNTASEAAPPMIGAMGPMAGAAGQRPGQLAPPPQ